MLLGKGDALSSPPPSLTPPLHGHLSYGEAELGQKTRVVGLIRTYWGYWTRKKLLPLVWGEKSNPLHSDPSSPDSYFCSRGRRVFGNWSKRRPSCCKACNAIHCGGKNPLLAPRESVSIL